MKDPLTGIHEPTVIIPWWIDCRKAKCPIMIKTKDDWVNVWINWIVESK